MKARRWRTILARELGKTDFVWPWRADFSYILLKDVPWQLTNRLIIVTLVVCIVLYPKEIKLQDTGDVLDLSDQMYIHAKVCHVTGT